MRIPSGTFWGSCGQHSLSNQPRDPPNGCLDRWLRKHLKPAACKPQKKRQALAVSRSIDSCTCCLLSVPAASSLSLARRRTKDLRKPARRRSGHRFLAVEGPRRRWMQKQRRSRPCRHRTPTPFGNNDTIIQPLRGVPLGAAERARGILFLQAACVPQLRSSCNGGGTSDTGNIRQTQLEFCKRRWCTASHQIETIPYYHIRATA
jgi:hypothetical protein